MIQRRTTPRPKAIWMEAFPEQVKANGRQPHRQKRYRIRARSKSMATKMRLYREARSEFLAKNRWCAVFPAERATEIHHKRGRAGELLLDERFWLAVSRKGHHLIDNNRNEARRRGLLCQVGEWGKQN